jgi:hypothetical protein
MLAQGRDRFLKRGTLRTVTWKLLDIRQTAGGREMSRNMGSKAAVSMGQ